MKQDDNNITNLPQDNEGTDSRHPVRFRILKRIGIGIAIFIGIIAVCITGILLWATPERITSISEKEASKYLKGDIQIHGLDYSIISSFPYLSLRLDSISINSRTLDNLDPATRNQLPDDCDLVMQSGAISGKLNVLKLIFGKIDLHRLTVDRLKLNLVSVNDSINNYDIFPHTDSHKFNIPKFQVDSIAITHPGPISFFSLQSQTSANVGINDIVLSRIPQKENEYNLRTSGKISASVNNLPLLADFPFSLGGSCGFDFNPFKVKLSDYKVNLGNIKGILNLNLRVDSDPQIEQLSYQIQEFNPLELLIYIPQGLQSVPILKNIKSSIDLNASAAIETPYLLMSPDLPSLKVNFSIPDGKITYLNPGGTSYTADRVNMDGELYYNAKTPADSYLNISEMAISSGDVTLSANANVSDVFGNPQLKAEINLTGELGKTPGLISNLNQYLVKGSINCNTEIEASLSSAVKGYVEDIKGKGNIHVEDFRISPRGKATGNMSASVRKLDLKLNGGFNPKDHEAKESLDILCNGSGLSYKSGGTSANVQSLNLSTSLSKKTASRFVPSGRVRPHSDERSLKRIKHSPEYITFTPVKALSDILEKYDGNLDFSLNGGKLYLPEWPAATNIARMEMALSPKGINLKKLDISNRSTHAHISGSIGNIHSFLTSAEPVKIPVKLNVRIDTINLNQLAGTYERGLMNTKGSIASIIAPKPASPSSSDSIAMLIPRNIIADISATADETIYTNLHLNNLMTKLRVNEGNLSVDTLTINSGFGDIYLKFGYTSEDINKLNMAVSAGILDINLGSLFKNFPKILEMAPEANNLHGTFSGRMSGEMDLFPTMYANIPSLNGVADIRGWDLTLHQNKFIRKITKMMMIPDADNIYIQDLNIKAFFRNNLLEIYPFDFNFNRYSLELAGVNNFNGKLYYHIAVKDSPLRLPFGINIEGYFHHPKLSSGGVEYKPENAQKVTSDIMMVNKINIMRELNFYLRMFIHHASKSDTIPSR